MGQNIAGDQYKWRLWRIYWGYDPVHIALSFPDKGQRAAQELIKVLAEEVIVGITDKAIAVATQRQVLS